MVETSFIATIACFRGYLLITDYPSSYGSKVLQKYFCQMNVYILKRYFCKSVSVNRCMYYWKGWKLIFRTFAAIHTVPSKKSILNNFYQPPKKLCSWKSLYAIYDFFSSSCSDPPPYTTPDSSRAESFVICNDGISTTPLPILSPFYHQWSIWKLNIYL